MDVIPVDVARMAVTPVDVSPTHVAPIDASPTHVTPMDVAPTRLSNRCCSSGCHPSILCSNGCRSNGCSSKAYPTNGCRSSACSSSGCRSNGKGPWPTRMRKLETEEGLGRRRIWCCSCVRLCVDPQCNHAVYLSEIAAFDLTFEIHSHKTLDTAQTCHLLQPTFFFFF